MDHAKQIDDLAEALASTESELRDAREALEAEIRSNRKCERILMRQRGASQAQLAEAVGLLTKARRYVEQDHPDGIHSYQPNSISGDLLGDVDAFLARHAQGAQSVDEPDSQELPGMWEQSDLAGGETDCYPARRSEKTVDERAAFEEAACKVLVCDLADFLRDATGEYLLEETRQLHRICQLYRTALATQPAALPTDPASWPLKVGAEEFVSQQEKWPDIDPSDFMHDALYEMIRVLTQPDVRGAEHE